MTEARSRFYALEGGGELAVSYDPAEHKRPHDLAEKLAKQMGVTLKKGVRSRTKPGKVGA